MIATVPLCINCKHCAWQKVSNKYYSEHGPDETLYAYCKLGAADVVTGEYETSCQSQRRKWLFGCGLRGALFEPK